MSSDTEGRHASFASAFDLPFPLLSDRDSGIAKAFGVARAGGWLPSRRVTFVIDREGVVRRVISAELDVNQHTREALAAVEALA